MILLSSWLDKLATKAARLRSSKAAKKLNLRPAAESKSGKPRYVPLNPEAVAHFEELMTGKTGDELVLTRADGKQMGPQPSRPRPPD